MREHNEDALCLGDLTTGVAELPDTTTEVGPEGIFFTVCDGMGGAAAGEVASKLASEAIFEELVRTRSGTGTTTDVQVASRLAAATLRAGDRICEESLKDDTRRGMGTTVTAAVLTGDMCVVAQVGDSRAYLMRGGTLTQITRDQSLLEKLLEANALTPEEAATFEHANVILQALGGVREVIVEVCMVRVLPGDRVLVCSDGLCGLVRDVDIATVLGDASSDPETVTRHLVASALEAGGDDNVTAVVLEVMGEPPVAPPAVEILDEAGRSGPRPPIPDPRNLLHGYAPQRTRDLPAPVVAVPVPEIAEPPSSTPTGSAAPAVPIPSARPPMVSSPPAVSVRPTGAPAAVPAANRADSVLRWALGAAVLVSVAIAGFALWSVTRGDPDPSTAPQASGRSGWLPVASATPPGPRGSAIPTAAASIPTIAIPPVSTTPPSPPPASERAAPSTKPTPPAPAVSHPPATPTAPKYEAPIPVEDYP